MNIKLSKIHVYGFLAASIGLTASMPARADHHDRGWHGDIHHFERHDLARWHGGYWHNGRHGGRIGWWWVVGGSWYFYNAPVYPYPDPYIPPAVVIQQSAPLPPVVESAAPPPAPAQNWYYCEASKSYYPYVASCSSGWKAVPATPPSVPPQ